MQPKKKMMQEQMIKDNAILAIYRFQDAIRNEDLGKAQDALLYLMSIVDFNGDEKTSQTVSVERYIDHEN
jgi:hypothetical protein